MHGDDSQLDNFRREVQEKVSQIAATFCRHETEIEKCWAQLNGLRETLENISERNTSR